MHKRDWPVLQCWLRAPGEPRGYFGRAGLQFSERAGKQGEMFLNGGRFLGELRAVGFARYCFERLRKNLGHWRFGFVQAIFGNLPALSLSNPAPAYTEFGRLGYLVLRTLRLCPNFRRYCRLLVLSKSSRLGLNRYWFAELE